MNNSFARLIDGLCATLRQEVLTRLDDDFARGQVFGVINVLNTFKVRADWSPVFLLEQLAAQQRALQGVRAAVPAGGTGPALPPLPALAEAPLPPTTPAAELLQRRDAGNDAIASLLQWLDGPGRTLPDGQAAQVEALLRDAMRAEVDIELKHSPRPLFAEMSSGREN